MKIRATHFINLGTRIPNTKKEEYALTYYMYAEHCTLYKCTDSFRKKYIKKVTEFFSLFFL